MRVPARVLLNFLAPGDDGAACAQQIARAIDGACGGTAGLIEALPDVPPHALQNELTRRLLATALPLQRVAPGQATPPGDCANRFDTLLGSIPLAGDTARASPTAHPPLHSAESSFQSTIRAELELELATPGGSLASARKTSFLKSPSPARTLRAAGSPIVSLGACHDDGLLGASPPALHGAVSGPPRRRGRGAKQADPDASAPIQAQSAQPAPATHAVQEPSEPSYQSRLLSRLCDDELSSAQTPSQADLPDLCGIDLMDDTDIIRPYDPAYLTSVSALCGDHGVTEADSLLEPAAKHVLGRKTLPAGDAAGGHPLVSTLADIPDFAADPRVLRVVQVSSMWPHLLASMRYIGAIIGAIPAGVAGPVFENVSRAGSHPPFLRLVAAFGGFLGLDGQTPVGEALPHIAAALEGLAGKCQHAVLAKSNGEALGLLSSEIAVFLSKAASAYRTAASEQYVLQKMSQL